MFDVVPSSIREERSIRRSLLIPASKAFVVSPEVSIIIVLDYAASEKISVWPLARSEALVSYSRCRALT